MMLASSNINSELAITPAVYNVLLMLLVSYQLPVAPPSSSSSSTARINRRENSKIVIVTYI